MKPTDEQKKEFWERCGLRTTYDDEIQTWHYPDGCSEKGFWEWTPTIDQNNLFKYAVPFLKTEYHNWKSVLHDWVDELTGDYEKDALALFWAIWEVI